MVSVPPSAGLTATVIKPFLAGGLVLSVLGLLVDFQGIRGWLPISERPQQQDCEAIVQGNAKLSREQLAKLLTIPERDSKVNVQKVLAEPFCRLPQIQVRSGVNAEREAYPLAFDPDTQLVILYENEEYAGYRFRFE